MALNRTDTDFRDLDHRLQRAITREDMDRFERKFLEDMHKLAVMQENHGTRLAETIMQLREMRLRSDNDQGAVTRIVERLGDQGSVIKELNSRMNESDKRQDRVKYMVAGGIAVATSLGALALKVGGFWLSHT